jgi:hypothetical protein
MLAAEGVGVWHEAPPQCDFGLILGGGIKMSGHRNWEGIFRPWSEMERNPEYGWRGLVFRAPRTRDASVLMRLEGLGRILAVTEQQLVENGRLDML